MLLTDAFQGNQKLAADCCGRVRGTLGIYLATIGPGATNTIGGAAGAFVDSAPLFVLIGQANSRLIRYEMETGTQQHGTQSLDLESVAVLMVK